MGEGPGEVEGAAAAVVVEHPVGQDGCLRRHQGHEGGHEGAVTGRLVDVAVAVVVEPVALLPGGVVAAYQVEPPERSLPARNGWAGSTPVSSTATVVPLPAAGQAAERLTRDAAGWYRSLSSAGWRSTIT